MPPGAGGHHHRRLKGAVQRGAHDALADRAGPPARSNNRDVDRVVPVVELFLDRAGNVDASHLQDGGHFHRLLARIGVHREDLAIGVAQEIAPDPAGADLRTL